MKKFGLVLILSVVAAWLALAVPADNFKAGGLEFGGNFMYSYRPLGAILSSNTALQDKGAFFQDIDGALDIGFFPIDNLSIGLMPSVYWFRQDSPSSSFWQTLLLSLDAGASYYVPVGGKLVISLVGKLGLGIEPGMNGMDSGSPTTDKSLTIIYTLEPDIGLYYFVSDHFAPFIQAGCKFMDTRYITDSSGSSIPDPSGHQFFDDVTVRVSVTIGLKYFLPVGHRFNETHSTTFDDAIDNDIIGK